MGKHEDKLFMKRFSAVIGVMVAITVVIMIIAVSHEPAEDPTRNPSKLALAAERVAPMGAVRTEMPSGEELAQVAAQQPASEAAAPDGGDGSDRLSSGWPPSRLQRKQPRLMVLPPTPLPARLATWPVLPARPFLAATRGPNVPPRVPKPFTPAPSTASMPCPPRVAAWT